MLYADDACIVLRSPQGLAKMMEVIIEVCRAFALTVPAKTTETMCMYPPRTPRTMVQVEAAGQTYEQVQSFTYYIRGAMTEVPDMLVVIARWTRACWMCIRRYLRELHDQPKVTLSLKTRMVKAGAIEALLYGCSTWTLCQEHYAKLRTVHRLVLLRIIGAQRKRPDHRMTSYNRALEITRCESIEMTLRTRRLLWAWTLLRMSGGRLPKRIVFATEALLYGCSTWTLCQEHYAKLCTVHRLVLLRIIEAQRKRPDHRMTSYNRALEITRCKSIETTLRTRRFLWAGTLLRMSSGGCRSESFSETFRMQYGEDGLEKRKSEPIASRATSGRLV